MKKKSIQNKLSCGFSGLWTYMNGPVDQPVLRGITSPRNAMPRHLIQEDWLVINVMYVYLSSFLEREMHIMQFGFVILIWRVIMVLCSWN